MPTRYVEGNPKSKAEIKRWLADGKAIRVFNPGLGDVPPKNGRVTGLCGPHFPAAHKWYGNGEMKDGYLISIE